MSQQSQYVKKHQDKRKKLGLCRSCKEPATKGLYCDFHRDQANEASEKIRAERLRNNRCVRCGDPLNPASSIYCTIHLNREHERRKKGTIRLTGGLALLLGRDSIEPEELHEAKKNLRNLIKQTDFVLDDEQESCILEYRILSDNLMTMRGAAQVIGKSYEWVRILEMKVAEKLLKYSEKKQ